MMERISRLFQNFARDVRGVVVMELAFIIPTMLVMVLGATELGRYVYLNMKMQNTAAGVADVATRDEFLTLELLEDVYWAASRFAQPFDIQENGVIVVSGIGVDENGDPLILWQQSGGGALAATSDLGASGEVAVLPNGLVLQEGDTAVVAEVVFAYEPWLGDILGERTIRKVAFYRPRLGALDELASGT